MEQKKVLVIDDDEGIVNLIQDFLEEKGFQVFIACRGEEGLTLAAQENPSLIILDVGLPTMNGYEVCRRIRDIAQLRYTPIIMLTAHTLDLDELNGFKAGADDYLTKPFKPARLLARIQTAIDRNMRELNANSLTHLPGNMLITEEIGRRIKSKTEFAVLYMDLNDFKAFNDRYGFVKGDEAIQLTAKILSKFNMPFLGHVGGDDFVGIVDSIDVTDLCEKIIKKFDEAICTLYSKEDRAKGGITSLDRKGNKVEYPIMGIAIAVVTNKNKTLHHPGEVALVAGDLKKLAKTQGRSAYVIDRRS